MQRLTLLARLLLVALVIGVLQHSTAHAAEPRKDPGARVRVGIGGAVSVAHSTYQRSIGGNESVDSTFSLAPELLFDIGAQLSDELALYVHSKAGTVLLFSHVASFGVVEWTPTKQFSIGSGLGVDYINSSLLLSDASQWTGVAAPLIAAFNWTSPTESGRRSGLRATVEGALGSSLYGVIGGHVGFSLTYVAM